MFLRIFFGLSEASLAFYHCKTVAGSVIQATGTVEYEDGFWTGNHLRAANGLQRIRTILGAQPRSSRGRLNSNLFGSPWLLGVEPGVGFDSRLRRW